MDTLHHPGADLAPRHVARKAVPLKGEDPGLAGVGVFKSVQQNSRLAPLGHHCERPAAAGQQVEAPNGGHEPRMSSLEVSALTDCRHDKVRQSIERLADRGAITLPPLGEVSNDGPGPKRISVYLLDERSSYIVVAQLSPEFTARLVDRWRHLEDLAAKPTQPAVPTSFREALLLAADQQEVIERQAKQIAITAPKAGALDRIAVETEGAVSLRVAAKIAQVPEKQFIAFLLEQRWLYRQRDGGGLLGYADREKTGLVELKRVEIPRTDGPPKVVARVLLTQRGIAKAVELIERKASHLRKTTATGGPHQALPDTPVDGLALGGAP